MNVVDKSGRRTEKEKIEREGKESRDKVNVIHFANVVSTGSSDRFIDQLLADYACE